MLFDDDHNPRQIAASLPPRTSPWSLSNQRLFHTASTPPRPKERAKVGFGAGPAVGTVRVPVWGHLKRTTHELISGSLPRRRVPADAGHIADPPAPACCSPVSGSGIAQSQSLDLISPVSRAARGGAPIGHSDKQPGLIGRGAGWWLLFGCKLAAPKTKNPRICATNRENSLQIPCRFSQKSRPSQGLCGVLPLQSGAGSQSRQPPNLRCVGGAFC